MTDMTFPVIEVQSQHVDLRVGLPYANLLVHQQRFVQALGQHFRVNPACIIPTVGATGAIEAVRNHVFKTSKQHTPVVYMLSLAILREGEKHGRYEIVRPPRWVESGYVLIQSAIPPIELQKCSKKRRLP